MDGLGIDKMNDNIWFVYVIIYVYYLLTKIFTRLI